MAILALGFLPTILLLLVVLYVVVHLWHHGLRWSATPIATTPIPRLPGRVALVTGATAGIGEALVDRLCAAGIHVIFGVRSPSKAVGIRDGLLARHPGARVDVIAVDVSEPATVQTAVAAITKKFDRLDYVFLNAGIFPHHANRWTTLLRSALDGCLLSLFELGHHRGMPMLHQSPKLLTAWSILNPKTGSPTNRKSPFMGLVFATNVFGHFLLIEGLLPLLEATARRVAHEGDAIAAIPSGRVIWTGSRASNSHLFNWNDPDHQEGIDPYGSSKFTTDLLSVAWNSVLAERQSPVRSFSSCPGFVYSSMMPGSVRAFQPFFWLLSFWIHNFSYTPYNGAEVLVRLMSAPAGKYDCANKYAMHHKETVKTIQFDRQVNVQNATKLYKLLQIWKSEMLGSS